MAVVKPSRSSFGNKKLRTVGAGSGIGHGQNSRNAVAQCGMELVGKLVAWSARTLTVGVSALNHELRNYAVKNEPVIKRNAFLGRHFGVVSLCKCYEVGYRYRGLFHFKLNEDVASACLKQGI